MNLLRTIMILCLPGLLMAAADSNDPLRTSLRPAIHENKTDESANVWVTGALAKVQPRTLPGPLHHAEISAGRNEFESFQVHVRATREPVQFDLFVSDFIGSAGKRIPADPNVQVFRESYSRIRPVSDMNGLRGLVPDALIPVRDSIFHEKRTAFPVTIPSWQTRSAWIDVFVPASTPSGYYSATVVVKNGATILSRLPVVLKVWDFQIPSTASLKSAFGLSYGSLALTAYKGPENLGNFPGANGDPELGMALSNIAIAKFFLDHRVSISDVSGGTFPRGDWRKFDSLYGPLLDGDAQTILKGARLTSFQYPNYGAIDASDLADWIEHFRSKGWAKTLFNYVCDEPPNGCSWAELAQRAADYHVMAPGIPNLVTTTIDDMRREGILSRIDILTVPLNNLFRSDRGDQRSRYDSWLAEPGKEIWWYQACNQHQSCFNGTPGPKSSTSPSYMIDASPVRNRVYQWMAYLYRIGGELYYQTDLWKDDPWNHLYSFGGNGDGALFYPGTADKIGGHTPVPVASIRLKLIREGMEDYEYLHALEQMGQGEFCKHVSRTFIQNALTFNNSPEAFMAAREQLGAELHSLVRSRLPPR